MYAATHGLNTVVLQKGNTAISNGWCANAINNQVWLESGGEPFNTGKLYAEFAEVSNGRDDGKLVMNFLNRGGEVMDWILDNTKEKTPVVVEKGQSLGWYVDNDFSTRYTQYAELLKLMKRRKRQVPPCCGTRLRYSSSPTKAEMSSALSDRTKRENT